jgi:hypothetical protein
MDNLEQPSGDSAVVDETAPPIDATGTLDSPPGDTGTDLLNEQAPVVDEVEEDLDGVKIRGPKEVVERVKAERLMQADYTRKTQDVAENRRQLEAERAQFQQTAQSHQQHIREVAQVVAIDERLAQFQNVNWTALTDQDPVQALKLHTEFTRLQADRGQLVNTLTQKQQQAQHEQQRNSARQLMEARQVLERDIKGWSPELAGKLMEHGVKKGIPADAMQNITNPALVKLLHDSYLLDQLQKQRTAKAPVAPAPPATRLSGSGAVSTKDPASMSDREFAEWRGRQIAQRK